MIMELLSKEYGWTPNEIREMSIEDIENYVTIIRIRRKEEENNIKQNGR